MALDDINAGEAEGDRVLDKWAKPLFLILMGLGIGANVYFHFADRVQRGRMNEEMREFRKDCSPGRRYVQDSKKYL